MENVDAVRNVNALFDAVIVKMQLKNDAALARVLDVAPPVISKIRHGKISVGPTLLIQMHETSGMAIRELKEWLSRQTLENPELATT